MSDASHQAAAASARTHWNEVYAHKPLGPHPVDHPVLVAALEHFGDVRGLRVCDLGSGTGEYALAFLRAGAKVTAIDYSQEATARLRAHALQAGLEDLTVICGDALRLAEFGPFDCVFGAMILHHLEPFEQAVVALQQALTPDGRAFFHENNAGVGRFALAFRRYLTGRLWFPKYGDDQEFPLTSDEVAKLSGAFHVRVVYPELALFRLVSHYVFRERFAPGLFAWLDRTLYRWPAWRRFSYLQYLYLLPARRA
ncbi:MAG: methyltransferase domain-containing protein [Candidatus Sericytochromatia bacterium]|nr:methyltransferase domain-containing protein [Candidatus Sericytochromatia bacterium]